MNLCRNLSDDDIHHIQQALGITLPAPYVALCRDGAFPPLHALEPEDFPLLFDNDPAVIIQTNLALRAGGFGGFMPWPAYFYAFGADDDGNYFFLDLRIPPEQGTPVIITDLEGQRAVKFAADFTVWMQECIDGWVEEDALLADYEEGLSSKKWWQFWK